MTGRRDDFRLVALLSTYREGRLARVAVDSCFRDGIDEVVVWEGPAGTARCEQAPATDLESVLLADYREGEWGSDAAKRTEMLRYAKQRWHDRPLWLLILDGDELLVHGECLRDCVQQAIWSDLEHGASFADPDNLPTGGVPLRIVEPDGSVCLEWGRVLNAQAIRRHVVSTLIVETVHGVELRLGHRPERAMPLALAHSRRGMTAEEAAVAELHTERHFLVPPLPGEPLIVHRSQLRHPARRSLRLSEQELSELSRLGYPVAGA